MNDKTKTELLLSMARQLEEYKLADTILDESPSASIALEMISFFDRHQIPVNYDIIVLRTEFREVCEHLAKSPLLDRKRLEEEMTVEPEHRWKLEIFGFKSKLDLTSHCEYIRYLRGDDGGMKRCNAPCLKGSKFCNSHRYL